MGDLQLSVGRIPTTTDQDRIIIPFIIGFKTFVLLALRGSVFHHSAPYLPETAVPRPRRVHCTVLGGSLKSTFGNVGLEKM